MAVSVLPILILFTALPKLCLSAESSLTIIAAGVQSSEDAPNAPADYPFLPGDFVYFTFQISGFDVQSSQQGQVRTISLTYQITPEDTHGAALAPPTSGAILTELSPEDKNWLPKRRASFLIPSFVAAGEFKIHVSVEDLIGKTSASDDVPFRIGGTQIQPAGSITVQNFHFFRNQNDREPLQIPAYSPGDPVYARFDMTGFKIDAQNRYHLAYGLSVVRPDGKPFIEQPNAAELQAGSFYPAQYVPGILDLKTSTDVPRGEYVITLTVRDLMANSSYDIKKAFSVE